MPYIKPETILEAKKVDLLSYLRAHEPDELVRCSGGYCTRTHDSLKISNGMWMWWSRGIGGRSALDYLVKVKGMDFTEAVQQIVGDSCLIQPVSSLPTEKEKKLLLPERNASNEKVMQYLTGRGISKEIIQDCIEAGIIYESLPHNNVVFVGKDDKGQPRYAAFRGTNASRVMGDCSGSDKHYSFRLMNPDSRSIHVFESAIDALSYATLIKLNGGNYKTESLISLAGVYSPGSDGTGRTPSSLEVLLKNNPGIEKIYLHLDNDAAGRNATRVIQNNLSHKYKIVDRPLRFGKDINDYLCHKLGIQPQRKRSYER